MGRGWGAVVSEWVARSARYLRLGQMVRLLISLYSLGRRGVMGHSFIKAQLHGTAFPYPSVWSGIIKNCHFASFRVMSAQRGRGTEPSHKNGELRNKPISPIITAVDLLLIARAFRLLTRFGGKSLGAG